VSCLVSQCQSQPAAVAADDDDDNVANDTDYCLVDHRLSRMLVLAVTNAAQFFWHTAFQLVMRCSHDLRYLATRSVLWRLECTKFVFRRSSAPDPAGGAHDAPPDPLVGWGGGYPSHIFYPLDVHGASFSAPTAPYLEWGGNLLQGLRGGDKRSWNRTSLMASQGDSRLLKRRCYFISLIFAF